MASRRSARRRLAPADLSFRPGEQVFDIALVAPDEKNAHRSDRRDQAWVIQQPPSAKRCRQRAAEGGERRDPERRGDGQPDQNQYNPEPRRQPDAHAKRGGNAFTATKREKDRKQVTEKCCNTHHSHRTVVESRKCSNYHRGPSLKGVAEQDYSRGALSAEAKDIGSARVTRSA